MTAEADRLAVHVIDAVGVVHDAAMFGAVAKFQCVSQLMDDFLDQPTESLIYVFYPDGNPGLIEFTTDVINKVGVPYRLSRVTRYQTAAGMMPVKEMDNGNDKKGL